jgi:hypothetical protein
MCEQRKRTRAVRRYQVPGRYATVGRYQAAGRGWLRVWVGLAAAPARQSRGDGKRIKQGLGWGRLLHFCCIG